MNETLKETEKNSAIIKHAPKGTAKIFEFEDHGQDFLYWCVDQEGEVLAALPFQSSVWAESMVAPHVMELALPGDSMDYTFKDGMRYSLKYPIVNIISIEP